MIGLFIDFAALARGWMRSGGLPGIYTLGSERWLLLLRKRRSLFGV